MDVTAHTPDGRTVGGWVAGDPGRPGLVLVHEWYGLNAGIKDMAARFAAHGYQVFAVDLYEGAFAADDAHAAPLAQAMQTAIAMQDVAGARDWLKAHGSARVGVTGFCLGGAMALAAACTVEGIACAVPFYGTPRDAFLRFGTHVPPTLGHYARHDAHVDLQRVMRIDEAAREAGAPFTLHVYDAGHAFLRHGDPSHYDAAAATLAWDRTLAFLAAHLG